MDRATFEAGLEADGFAEALTRRMEAGATAPDHAHPFDARLFVLEGEFILDQGGTTRRYGPGEAFEVPAGVPHAESFGPAGATYLVGRRAKP
ncbi:cupin domain-containing protein [Falsiroseomonas sp. CW058]|uniref:cupin domain-containing protein n=1 Tax=Falsiroseomonas sp. CW058 TaxID=3388664 RepID=UPI003D32208B